MSLNVHALHAYLDEIKDNMCDYSDEQSERFLQNVRSFEKHRNGQYNEILQGLMTF